jgi:hypothetical protein
MLSTYRNIRIDTQARLTSANSGSPCTSASAAESGKKVSEKAPNFFNADIAKKISVTVGTTYDQAVVLLRDASNFLWLASQAEVTSVPSPIIDEAWHVFVLFTREYADFCHTYCGGYVHHEPHVGPEIKISEEYVRPTVDLMYKLFGSVPSKNWEYVSVKDWLTENKVAA